MAFTPPKSLQEAEEHRNRLTKDVQDIQTQLGTRQVTDEVSGRVLTSKEFHQWRGKAQQALNAKLAELRELKNWIRNQRSTQLAENYTPGDVLSLLKRSYRLFRTLETEDVPFDTKEVELFDEIRRCLDKHGIPTNGAEA